MVINTNISNPPQPPVQPTTLKTRVFARDTRFDTDLSVLNSNITEWIQKAKAINVDIQEQIDGLVYTISNAAPLIDPVTQKVCEIVQKQQVIVRSFFCNQIICKITHVYVQTLASDTRRFFPKPKEQELVDQLEEELIKKIPVSPVLDSIFNMESIFMKISIEAFNRFEDMKAEKVFATLPKYRRYAQ